MRYYSLKNILKKNATYNIVIGERSNGKTYSALELILKNYIEKGEHGAIIRRWRDDFIGKRGQSMFSALESNGVIKKLTNGEWTGVYFFSGRWYLCRYEDDKRITQEEPFCYGFSITSMEHDKSTSYPKVTTIVFDEFLSRSGYLNDEFVLFMNVISTIVRQRNNVKIFMLGNTVNKYSPYFKEMGLTHIKDMKPGDIDLYTYGKSELTVAVEYAKPNREGKESDKYFAFDNPKLSMITGGAWEIDIYPHCPIKYKPKHVKFRYYIIFDGTTLECEIVFIDNLTFTFIHEKTSELKDPDNDIIYTTEFDPRPNYFRKITKPITPLEKKISLYYVKDLIYYADNEIGEVVRNYLEWCNRN